MNRLQKIKWANALIKSKFFVLLTDKEAVLALDTVDPKKFTDVLTLAAQQTELELFVRKLTALLKVHDEAAARLVGQPNTVSKSKGAKKNVRTTTNRKTASKPSNKVKK